MRSRSLLTLALATLALGTVACPGNAHREEAEQAVEAAKDRKTPAPLSTPERMKSAEANEPGASGEKAK